MATRANAGRPSQPARQENKPAHEVRLGRIRCTVWRNEHEKTGTWYSMTLSRSYKDDKGQWKSATSFGRDDLLVIGEVCRRALWWIQEQYFYCATSHSRRFLAGRLPGLGLRGGNVPVAGCP